MKAMAGTNTCTGNRFNMQLALFYIIYHSNCLSSREWWVLIGFVNRTMIENVDNGKVNDNDKRNKYILNLSAICRSKRKDRSSQ